MLNYNKGIIYMSDCDTKEYDMVIYHKDCADGFASAWIAWRNLKNVIFFPAIPQQSKLPADIKGKNILMVDVTFTNESTMNYLRSQSKRLCIIDHHSQATKTLRKQDSYIFTESNSAAVLTWKYFYPDKEIPIFIQLIESGDLPPTSEIKKQKKFKYAPYFNAALPFRYEYKDIKVENIEQNFKKFGELLETENVKKVILTGKAISPYKEDLIRKNCLGSLMKFEGYKVIVHNFSTIQLRSDVGNMLAVKNKDRADFAVVWSYEHMKKRYSVSLRNPINKDRINLNDIAMKYGSGGHPGAATFYYTGNLFELFSEL